MEPKLLMLDEPISGLTAEEKEESAYRINEIRGRFKVTILLVEHDLKIASRLADRMVAFSTVKKWLREALRWYNVTQRSSVLI